MLLIPFALTYTFGKMVGDTRQGWVLLTAMLILFVPLVGSPFHSEQHGNPLIAQQGIDQIASAAAGGRQHGGQGDPLRHRRLGAVRRGHDRRHPRGAVNTMHDSMMPLGGFVPMFLMQLGEVAPGGVGTGIYSILMFAILGRVHRRADDRPNTRVSRQENRGARDEAGLDLHPDHAVRGADRHGGRRHDDRRQGRRRESRRARLQRDSVCVHVRRATTTAARSAACPPTRFSTTWPLGLGMFIGRFWPIVAALAIAGSLAAKKRVPVTEGTMPTHGPLFVALLIGSILLIGVLNLCPGTRAGSGRRALHAPARQLRDIPCRGNNSRSSIASFSDPRCSSP